MNNQEPRIVTEIEREFKSGNPMSGYLAASLYSKKKVPDGAVEEFYDRNYRELSIEESMKATPFTGSIYEGVLLAVVVILYVVYKTLSPIEFIVISFLLELGFIYRASKHFILLDILGGSFIRKDKELYDQSLKKYNKLYLIAIILLTAVYSSYFLIYRFDFLWLFITFTSVIIYQYLYITALMYSIQEKRKYAGSVEYLKVEEEIEERDD
jgi:hypothetical protein